MKTIISLCIVIGVALFLLRTRDNREWQKFVAVHHCQVIGHVSDSFINSVTVDSKGKVGYGSGYIPEKTGYSCDNGQQYWR